MIETLLDKVAQRRKAARERFGAAWRGQHRIAA